MKGMKGEFSPISFWFPIQKKKKLGWTGFFVWILLNFLLMPLFLFTPAPWPTWLFFSCEFCGLRENLSGGQKGLQQQRDMQENFLTFLCMDGWIQAITLTWAKSDPCQICLLDAARSDHCVAIPSWKFSWQSASPFHRVQRTMGKREMEGHNFLRTWVVHDRGLCTR